jgi:thiol-disulfide isomerase/thioredoxin
LAVVAINPNNPTGLDLSELGYSKYNDTFADMKLYAHDRGFTFPYVYDGKTQRVAKAYGCLCTPDLFIFDADRRLRYKGRLDNSQYPEADTVKTHEAQDAIDELLAGQRVARAETAPFGCATKWIEKRASVARINEQWESTPVTIEEIDSAGVAALVRNDSPRVRLINVWATWCVPCVEEFPDLVRLVRQFQTRRFEMITLSTDEPAKEGAALRFLQKQHAATPNHLHRILAAEGRTTDNYRFQGTHDDLQGALDSQWPGPVPYTLVVAPGGKILYRHVGAIDPAELRALLVDQLGAYYNPQTKD